MEAVRPNHVQRTPVAAQALGSGRGTGRQAAQTHIRRTAFVVQDAKANRRDAPMGAFGPTGVCQKGQTERTAKPLHRRLDGTEEVCLSCMGTRKCPLPDFFKRIEFKHNGIAKRKRSPGGARPGSNGARGSGWVLETHRRGRLGVCGGGSFCGGCGRRASNGDLRDRHFANRPHKSLRDGRQHGCAAGRDAASVLWAGR